MRILRHWHHTPPDGQGAVVAIGNFDGLHRGHRAVIDECARIARCKKAPLAVLTFEPHPRQVLSNSTMPFRLTPFRVKARGLAELGVEILYLVKFDAHFAAKEPETFVMDVLITGIRARHVVVGYDFAFGRERRGDVRLLNEIGSTEGFEVTHIEAARTDTGIYSASEARRLLALGDVSSASRVLGHDWEIDGWVVSGDQRGRTIGFPTANLQLRNTLHPERGVYAVWVKLDVNDERWWPAVANLGHRPTFNKTENLLEIHIFGFTGDLYGKRLRAAFVERVRPELKFDGIEDLKKQIERDCESARRILSCSTTPRQMELDSASSR